MAVFRFVAVPPVRLVPYVDSYLPLTLYINNKTIIIEYVNQEIEINDEIESKAIEGMCDIYGNKLFNKVI